LDVARMTSGRIDLAREPVDLRAAIEQAVEREQFHVDAKRQQVILALGDGPVTVYGDPVRVHQIFGHLLNNAWKYSPVGGAIRITLAVEGDEAITSIRDGGAGIQPDKLKSIFELFTQANPALARTEGGLGIGLTLVKRLVELHGGGVQAHS